MENLISKFKSITTQSKNIIKKIILILIIFNVLIAIFMGLIPLDGIAKTIVVLLIAIVQILFLLKIFLVIKNQKDEKKENFEVKTFSSSSIPACVKRRRCAHFFRKVVAQS